MFRTDSIRLLAIACVLLLGGCKSDNTVNSIDDIVFPDKNISYDRTIQPLFNIACATSSCHDTKSFAGNLDLSSYSGIRQRFYDVVIVRDTVSSLLIRSIESRGALPPMPPGRPLTLNQRRGLKQWIMEGATDTIK